MKYRPAFTLIALALLFSLTGCPQQAPEASRYSYAIAELEGFIAKELERGLFAGGSIALVDDQEIVWAKGFGYSDLSSKTPSTEKTVYRPGSISKLFTDIGVMQLVEQGKIDLDANITNYIPDFHIGNPFESEAKTTLRQLMCHVSGFPRESPIGSYFDNTFPPMEITVKSIYGTELVYQPETKTKYSNIGVTLVGYALQQVSGENYVDYQRRHLLGPLGMADSDFVLNDELILRLSTAYMWVADGRQIQAPLFELGTIPAGNLYSTVEDLGRFLSFVFAGGKAGDAQLIKPETLDEMFQVQFRGEGQSRYFGLGFVVGDHRGHKTVGHTGGVYGFTSIITGLPDEKLGVVVLLNEDMANGPLYRIRDKALDLMLKAKLGEEPPAEPEVAEVDAAMMQGYAGEYESERYWAEIKPDGKGIMLVLSGQPMELLPLSETEFRVEGKHVQDGRLRFEALGEGEGFKMIYGGSEEFLPVDPATVPEIPPLWSKLTGKYGQDFIPLIVSVRHGHLYAFVENEFDYRLTPVSETLFNLPPGMYEGQQVEFFLGADGSVEKVVMAYVEFEPLEK